MIFFFKNDGDLLKFLNCIEDTGDTFFANIKDIGKNLVADINNTGRRIHDRRQRHWRGIYGVWTLLIGT